MIANGPSGRRSENVVAAPPPVRFGPIAGRLVFLLGAWSSAGIAQTPLAAVVVNGDAIDTPLTSVPGDPVRGRAIVANRQVGLCLLCHAGPIPEVRFQGNLAPNLEGAGSRWNEGQLRLRMVDARRLNPESIMSSYYRTEGLTRVAPALRGQPILSAQQIEDVVAYLLTLRTLRSLDPVSPTPPKCRRKEV